MVNKEEEKEVELLDQGKLKLQENHCKLERKKTEVFNNRNRKDNHSKRKIIKDVLNNDFQSSDPEDCNSVLTYKSNKDSDFFTTSMENIKIEKSARKNMKARRSSDSNEELVDLSDGKSKQVFLFYRTPSSKEGKKINYIEHSN